MGQLKRINTEFYDFSISYIITVLQSPNEFCGCKSRSLCLAHLLFITSHTYCLIFVYQL